MNELEGILNENSKHMEERNNQNRITDENTAEEIDNIGIDGQVQNKDNVENSIDESEIAEKVKQLPVVGVGDSVILAAAEGLYKVFPNGYFDGKVSRSMIGGEEVLTNLKNEGKLGNIVILALANNSDYFEWRIDRIMNILGDRQVYWVTAVLADDPEFNNKFRGYASDHSNIHIVEWEEKSKNHPEYFYGDGIHVMGDGIDAYANIIYEAIYEDYKKGVLKSEK
ncbi:MAG: hypothetical protein IKG14_01450 [Clostridia bacterium]|nr:hypothetical protein [Clostridia bacterium]